MAQQCEICGKTCKNSNGFGIHLRKSHGISLKEYLIQIKKCPVCPICGDYLSFIRRDFRKTCGKKECADMLKDKHMTETCLEKYGVKSVMQDSSVRTKYEKTCLKKYGVKSPLKCKKIKDKRKKTCLKKYGKCSFLHTPDYNSKTKKTCLEKYGVEFYTQSDDHHKKQLITKKKNGSFGKSIAEDNCYNFIINQIDNSCKRQVSINGWNIDFYLPKYDMYIQFDGDYWHGHLHTEKELKQTQQGTSILKTIKRDTIQNKKIPNLIRILESEFNHNPATLIYKLMETA